MTHHHGHEHEKPLTSDDHDTLAGETHREVQYKKLTREELEQIAGEPLPDRAAMSLVNANLAAPVKAAVAANMVSDDSIEYANPEQDGDIDEST